MPDNFDDIKNELIDAKNQFPANTQFLKILKKQNSRLLDKDFHSAHQNVFEETDCLQCANCCKTTSPIFYENDISRLPRVSPY